MPLTQLMKVFTSVESMVPLALLSFIAVVKLSSGRSWSALAW